MLDKGPRDLKKLDDSESRLPSIYSNLSEEEKKEVERKLIDQDLRLREEFLRKKGQSNLAEHDLAIAIDTVERLSQDGKVITEVAKGQTGSGTYELKIKGGDTKFIIPILVVIGAIILGIALIFIHK